MNQDTGSGISEQNFLKTALVCLTAHLVFLFEKMQNNIVIKIIKGRVFYPKFVLLKTVQRFSLKNLNGDSVPSSGKFMCETKILFTMFLQNLNG